jgi:chromate reductase, NAD(P)H dehydrogenase (quinone)
MGIYLASVSDGNWKMGPNMPGVNVAVIVGSNRRGSINRKLARALVRLADGKLAANFVQIDDLPMYNQDLESPLPASVARFKASVEEANAVLFVSPEHNRSIPAVLKNAIDWGTRPYGRNSWAGKPIAIIGTSPGAIGTAIAQQHLRRVLGNLHALVMGGEAYLTFKPGLIEEADIVTDAGTRRLLQSFADQFAEFAIRLTQQAHAPAA